MKNIQAEITFKGNDLFLRDPHKRLFPILEEQINRIRRAIQSSIQKSIQISTQKDGKGGGSRGKVRNGGCLKHWILYDERLSGIKIPPFLYHKLDFTDLLEKKAIEFNFKGPKEFDRAGPMFPEKSEKRTRFQLRGYQERALKKWDSHNNTGIVVLPTGGGKTYIGLEALARLQEDTLIVVPTLELLDQWYESIKKQMVFLDPTTGTQVEKPREKKREDSKRKHRTVLDYIGRYGGGKKQIRPITITTYSSLYLHLNKFRHQFDLLIFDEVHHLSGETYQHAVRGCIGPHRLGLTATLDVSGEQNIGIIPAVGPILYRLSPERLSKQGHLAEYREEKRFVSLRPDNYKRYKKYRKIYSSYVRKFKFRGKRAFQQMLFRANKDPDARRALNAYQKAKDIAFCAEEKLEMIADILNDHPEDRIIIFSEKIHLVEKISRRFLIPALTSNTPDKERDEIMQYFREGDFRIISTGRVLDEGVDVPEANVAIIVSGTGVPRQYIQRLGRILRPLPGKEALLYELVSSKTSETGTSRRRGKS